MFDLSPLLLRAASITASVKFRTVAGDTSNVERRASCHRTKGPDNGIGVNTIITNKGKINFIIFGFYINMYYFCNR